MAMCTSESTRVKEEDNGCLVARFIHVIVLEVLSLR